MVVVVFESFLVVECRVVCFRVCGFSFCSAPQTISYWGQSSFPDCSGFSSTSIALIFGLVCHGAGFLVGCQFFACGLNGLGSFFLSHAAALWPGLPQFRQSCSLMRRWNSSLDMLSLGRLFVASRSIGSP